MQNQPRSRGIPAGFPGQLGHQQQQQAPIPHITSPLFSPTGHALPSGASNYQPLPTNMDNPLARRNEDVNQNLARLCRIGQDLVQDIVQKVSDAFEVLKSTQVPNQIQQNVNAYQERKKHLQDTMKMTVTYFKKLRQVYNTVNESCAPLNLVPVQDLVPFEEPGSTLPPPKEEPNEALQSMKEYHDSLTYQLKTLNTRLKEIIDQLRNLLWEINAMMAMKVGMT